MQMSLATSLFLAAFVVTINGCASVAPVAATWNGPPAQGEPALPTDFHASDNFSMSDTESDAEYHE